jgi:lipoate-protein ligase A
LVGDRPELVLLRGSAGRGAVTELAVSHALLDRVASGWAPAAARLYVPAPTVAFGRVDAFRPEFEAAVEAARAHEFDPVLRAPGGRAAAYHEQSVVLELAVADADPRARIGDRFDLVADLVIGSLHGLDVPAERGELPREYCPGRFSVLAGGVKLGGIAQRVVGGASLTSIALVVGDGARVRAVLEDVSAALGYDFDPATAGAVADIHPGSTATDVEAALARALEARWSLRTHPLDERLLGEAGVREPAHRPEPRRRPAG